MIERRTVIRDWDAVFLFSLGSTDKRAVLEQLFDCHPPQSIVERVSENLDENVQNTGFTFSNARLRRSIVYIGDSSDGGQFLSTFVHELSHLTSDICRADDISLSGEEIAYLIGELALRLSPVVCHLACDNCRAD